MDGWCKRDAEQLPYRRASRTKLGMKCDEMWWNTKFKAISTAGCEARWECWASNLLGSQSAVDRVGWSIWFRRRDAAIPWPLLDVWPLWHRYRWPSGCDRPFAAFHSLRQCPRERSVDDSPLVYRFDFLPGTSNHIPDKSTEQKLTCEMKMPGSRPPNGTQEWSVPPIILNPSEPWFFGRITSYKRQKKKVIRFG